MCSEGVDAAVSESSDLDVGFSGCGKRSARILLDPPVSSLTSKTHSFGLARITYFCFTNKGKNDTQKG